MSTEHDELPNISSREAEHITDLLNAGAAQLVERDELIELVWDGAVADRVKDGLDPEFVPVVRPKVEALADAILAAGYSKHSDELARAMRGAKTLGEIIEKQCREVLDVTGLHHLINEDGDGPWDVVWMRLHEMRDDLASLKESTIGRERLRGDSWRDRAQEMDSRAQSLEAELQAVKPQQITTAVELAALPRFTVIRSADGLVFERQTMWHEAGSRDLKYWTDISLPATVLQLGWGEE